MEETVIIFDFDMDMDMNRTEFRRRKAEDILFEVTSSKFIKIITK